MSPPVEPATLAMRLDALALAAQLLAQDLRSGLADLSALSPSVPVDHADALLSATELAKLLSIDSRTLRRWRHQGRAPKPLKGQDPLRWRRSDVERWIEGHAA